MVDYLLQVLASVPPWISVAVLAAAPVVELRAAIPVGLGVYDMPLEAVIPLVLIANMLPVFFILYAWDKTVQVLARHWPWLHQLLEKRYQKMQVEWNERIEKYGPLALILFVAVPLPGSGAWTGALVAWLFGLSKPRAIASLFAGVFLSAVGVTIITITGLQLF